jgi:hypothetical protein
VTRPRPGDVHPELRKRPWEREYVYKAPAVLGGRTDLPAIVQEEEALMRLIGTLPTSNPWWPGHGNMLEAAYEARALLLPRINAVTLGRWQEDIWIWYLFNGPGPRDQRCATLCVPHPTEEAWLAGAVPRSWLLFGEKMRNLLIKHVSEASARAMREEAGKHFVLAEQLRDR